MCDVALRWLLQRKDAALKKPLQCLQDGFVTFCGKDNSVFSYVMLLRQEPGLHWLFLAVHLQLSAFKVYFPM